MYYRNEWKYLVTDADLAVLGARLKVLLPMDKHQTGSAYAIRSLYFDDLQNSCLRENEAGVDDRRKFRLRLYNGSAERIQLEIKEKLHGKTHKSSCLVSADECRRIMAGNVRITFDRNISACVQLGSFLEPKVHLTPILPAGQHVLEVKFDEFLPDYVAQALELGKLRQTAFSKYYLCRLALPGPMAERTREYEF